MCSRRHKPPLNHRLSVAPMMNWTDRHCRFFLRLLAKDVVLYTEMVTTGAILHGDREYHLGFDPREHPLVLQLGGSDPQALAECARIAEGYGYDEINLNIGCPSDRVQFQKMGACLMAEPELVARCVATMKAAVSLPVTVKTRIGIDEQDSEEALDNFVKTVAQGGCEHFIIHARKAWLKGLSPKENREVPPLRYEVVRAVKTAYPHLQITLNGGLTTIDAIKTHLNDFDGIMLGRAAYHNPYLIAQLQHEILDPSQPLPTRAEIVNELCQYIVEQTARGVRLQSIARHILGLFQGIPGARKWRRTLSEYAPRGDAGVEVVTKAFSWVEGGAL